MTSGSQAAAPAAGAPGSIELPLFPLGVVLFPGGLLRLRIFEPRYLGMISRCMRQGAVFGVVLLLEGRDTGAGAARRMASVGTSARIVDFDTLPDGLLGISCTGERRFRLMQSRELDDGLNVGEVQWLPEEPVVDLPQALARVTLPDQQRLLELDDPQERLREAQLLLRQN